MEEKKEQPAETPVELPPQKNAILAILALLRNPTLIVGVIAAVLLGGMLAWKITAVSAVEKRLTAEKTQAVQQLQAEKAQAIEDGKKALLAAQREKLLLFAKPLAWALRDLVIADNQKQIDDYISELVRQPGFDRIVLARMDDSIALASDRKMIDGKLGSVYPPAVRDAQAPTVLNGEGGKLILVVPIMGQSEKLAIMVLTYDPIAAKEGMVTPAVPSAPLVPATPTKPAA